MLQFSVSFKSHTVGKAQGASPSTYRSSIGHDVLLQLTQKRDLLSRPVCAQPDESGSFAQRRALATYDCGLACEHARLGP